MKTKLCTLAEFTKLRNPDRTVRAPEGFDPNRTAYRCSGDWEYIFQEWPTRNQWCRSFEAQARALKRRTPRPSDWVPVHPQT